MVGIRIVNAERFRVIQSILRDSLDAVAALKEERDKLKEQVTEMEKEVAVLKKEIRMLRDAEANMQVQRDKFLIKVAQLTEDNKFLSAVLDNVSAKYNDELMDASISTALDVCKGA